MDLFYQIDFYNQIFNIKLIDNAIHRGSLDNLSFKPNYLKKAK